MGAGGDGGADDDVGLVHKVEGKRRECLVLGAMAASAASASRLRSGCSLEVQASPKWVLVN
jgi:hypothetical protein